MSGADDPTDGAKPGRAPIIDGHVDTLLAAHGNTSADGAFDERPDDHVDGERLRAGGVAAAFFAAFVPERDTADGFDTHPPRIDPSHARTVTDAMLDQLDAWIDAGYLRRITTAEDVTEAVSAARRAESNREGGADKTAGESDETAGELDETAGGADESDAGRAVGAITHLEGAAAIEPDLSNLADYYERGVRSIGVVWSRPNAFGHGVPFEHDRTPDTGPGLTDAGERLVTRCEERGILVDCAHMTADGLRDVARVTDRPLVVSHAGVHAVSPAARNLTDPLLELVASRNGIVGISFAAGHLRPDGERDPDTSLDTLLDHIDHAVSVTGVDHVGFGTDFDGARVLEPVGDPTGFDRVRAGLCDRGYTPGEIAKLTHGNWARVIRAWL